MSRKYIIFGRRSKPSDGDQAVPSHHTEERLGVALASLRRLSDFRQNPLTLKRAIDRVYDAALVYQRWRESGAIIRDIILRLSDGSEIKVDKATPTNTNLFGFRFRSAFPHGSVLNVYKGADQDFPEVLLYSIDLDVIPTDGLTFTMAYENGQMLMLKVEPSLARQFQISVDYTMSGNAISLPPPPTRRPFRLLPTLTQLAALCLLAALTIMAWQKYSAERGKLIGVAAPVKDAAAPTSLVMRQGESTNDEAHRAGLSALAITEAQVPQVAPRQKMPLTPDTDAFNGSDNAPIFVADGEQQTPTATSGIRVPIRRQGRVKQSAPAASAASQTAPAVSAPATVAARYPQLPIYIKVWTGNKSLDERMEKAFAGALARTNRFNVLAGDDGVPPIYYEVNLWFNPTEGRAGTIYYDLHDPNTPLIQAGQQNCRDIGQEGLIEGASQQLVRDMISKINTSRLARVRFESTTLQPSSDFECAACATSAATGEVPDRTDRNSGARY
jgi:hypothetical protein